MTERPLTRSRWYLVSLFALLPLMGWWLTGLFDLDEGFYAAVVAEMNRRGEWVTPYYNGKPWFEKPILLYWLAKPTVALFGEMVGPRLPSVIATLATYAVAAWFAARRLGDGVKTAQLTVLILASSLLVLGLGRMMMTDAPLLLAMTVAYLTFWESLVGDRRWRLLTAAMLGVGVLAKGPVACLLFVPVAGWTYWRQPDLRPAFKGYWLGGFALLLAVVSTWYVPAYLANGQTFVQKFLIEQNIGRFTGGDAAHTLGVASMPAYIPIIFLGMIPWSVWIPRAMPWGKPAPAWAEGFVRRPGFLALLARILLFPFTWVLWGWVGRTTEDVPVRRYLACWATVVFLFFSLSGAKLPHYILPLFPPLALLVAYRIREARWAFPVGFGMAATMTAVANGVFLFLYSFSGQQEVHTLARYVRAQGGDVAVYQMSRRQKSRGTGSTKLQETSLPSLLLYLDRTVVDTDEIEKIAANEGPIWIITRRGRIGTDDFLTVKRQRRDLERIMGAPGGSNYELYRIR
jgi:4-amino-4-deoxy-L-arabinose transferase-like glycosyltransferase